MAVPDQRRRASTSTSRLAGSRSQESATRGGVPSTATRRSTRSVYGSSASGTMLALSSDPFQRAIQPAGTPGPSGYSAKVVASVVSSVGWPSRGATAMPVGLTTTAPVASAGAPTRARGTIPSGARVVGPGASAGAPSVTLGAIPSGVSVVAPTPGRSTSTTPPPATAAGSVQAPV